MRSASYDIESPDGDLENENVDWYAYDEQWRLIAVYRQDFKYQAFKLRERIVYADAGVGAREGGGPGMKLDCPAYAEIDEDLDGEFDRRLVYIQNRGGHVVAVYDDHLTRLDSPTDTTPSRWPARIAYTAFGEPINIGVAGLGIYAEHGNVYSRLDLDFNNDKHETPDDLAALTQVIGGAICDTPTQRCDNPDFNRDGEVNADDITAFAGAMAGTYRVFATDITDYRFLYRGYWYDKHLGIYHVRHRAYNPTIQRWLQPDPAMFIDGMNVYAYCGNEPFARYDAMGLDWIDDTINFGTGAADVLSFGTAPLARMLIDAAGGDLNGQIDTRSVAYRNGVATGVGTLVGIATGGAATGVVIGGTSVGGGALAGSMSTTYANVMIIGAAGGVSGDVASQATQMLLGTRDNYDFVQTVNSGLIGAILGPLFQYVDDLVRSGSNALPSVKVGRNPATGGRLGKETTREHVREVATELERRGWTITGGGGVRAEEYLPGVGGSRRGSNYLDITATKNGRTLRINTIDTLVDGVTPTANEARAAASIRAKTCGDHLLLIPKPR